MLSDEACSQEGYSEKEPSCSRVRFLQAPRLSLDSRMDVGQTAVRGPDHPAQGSGVSEHRHSLDLGLFKSWKRGISNACSGRNIRGRKKLSKQCKSVDGAIPEEHVAINCNGEVRQYLEFPSQSLDLFDLPSAMEQLRQSFKAAG